LANEPESPTGEMLAIRDGRVAGPDFTKRFGKTSVQIVMRDGAELHTEIYTPLDHSGPLPLMLVRSPYGLNPDKHGYAAWLREYSHLMKDGYIFRLPDTRVGEHQPEIHSCAYATKTVANSIDDSTDTLRHHRPGSSSTFRVITERVGTLGVFSYGGFSQPVRW